MKRKKKLLFCLAMLLGLSCGQTAWAKDHKTVEEEQVEKTEISEEAEEGEERISPTDYITVLMYHHFAIRDMGQGNNLVTTQAELQEQITYFKEQGYTIISLEELDKILQRVEKEKVQNSKNKKTEKLNEKPKLGLQKKYICITMDDGYFSNFDIAYPVCKENRVPMSIFVVTDYITNQIGLQKFNWNQAKKMVDSKYVKIYNHTANHEPYAEGEELDFLLSVRDGELALKEKLRQDKVSALAFPNGRNSEALREGLAELNVALAFTVEPGVITKQSHRHAIPRVTVESGMSGADVVDRIEEMAKMSFHQEERVEQG